MPAQGVVFRHTSNAKGNFECVAEKCRFAPLVALDFSRFQLSSKDNYSGLVANRTFRKPEHATLNARGPTNSSLCSQGDLSCGP